MKKRHSTANVLLIELVLVILFFMLCTSTIVEMFGHARVKSIYARSGNEAMLTVENLEERLACTADTEGELRKEGFELENGVWVLHRDTFTLTASESSEKTEAGSLRTLAFSAEQNNGTGLFDLSVVHYFPGEVSP